jgi:hypothetical protein
MLISDAILFVSLQILAIEKTTQTKKNNIPSVKRKQGISKKEAHSGPLQRRTVKQANKPINTADITDVRNFDNLNVINSFHFI